MKYVKQLKNLFKQYKPKGASLSLIDYWEDRVKTYGGKAVYNLGHNNVELDEVTTKQIDIIFPLLKKKLNGNEKVALDFGCGIGRFSKSLADLVSDKVIGLDPIQALLDLAPENNKVEYFVYQEGKLNVIDKKIDILFICLVLGGIKEYRIYKLLKEFKRILSPSATVCIIENISKIEQSNAYWFCRSKNWYENKFAFLDLKLVYTYEDLGEEIGIFMGKKKT